MKPLLILSDGHANPYALNEILRFAKLVTPDFDVRYLGDVWGYGYDPVEFYLQIKKLDPNWNAGNHDVYGVLLHFKQIDQWMGPTVSRNAIETDKLHLQQLGEAGIDVPSIEQIRQRERPRSEVMGNYRLVFVHASLQNFGEGYVAQYLLPNLRDRPFIETTCHIAIQDFPPPANGKTIIFTGHSHVPLLCSWSEKKGLTFHKMTYTHSQLLSDEIIFRCDEIDDSVILVNGGAVSMMRDGIAIASESGQIMRSHGILFDSSSGHLRFLQARYSAKTVLSELRNMYSLLPHQDRDEIGKELAKIYYHCYINGTDYYYQYSLDGFY